MQVERPPSTPPQKTEGLLICSRRSAVFEEIFIFKKQCNFISFSLIFKAIERFEITCKKTKSRLIEVRSKFNRIEPLSSQKEIEEIRSLHSKVVSDVDDDLKCSKEIAQTLEAIVKKPFSTKEVKPLSHFNFDYLEKWISNLDSMREELQALWKIHDKYLEDCSVLCQFELDYSEVCLQAVNILFCT